jgi:DNA polymerase-3 subunit gamma/tau
VVQAIGQAPDSFSVTADQTDRLEDQARAISQLEAVRAIDLVAEAVKAVKDGSEARIQLEVALLKAARPRSDASIEALHARIERLEQVSGERDTGPGPDGGQNTGPRPDGGPERPPSRKRITGATGKRQPPAAVSQKDPQEAKDENPDQNTGTDLQIGELESRWPAVLERIGAGDGGPWLAALLEGARPILLEEGRLVVSYPASAEFRKRKVEDPANKERVAEALRVVTGQRFALLFELSDEPADPSDQTSLESLLSEEDAIAAFKDAFDAEDVAVDHSRQESNEARVAKGEDA